MLTRGKLRSESFMMNMENFTQSFLAALEDQHVAELLQLILQPSVQEHLQPITDDLHNTIKDVQRTLGALQTIVNAKDQDILCLKREVNELQDKLDNKRAAQPPWSHSSFRRTRWHPRDHWQRAAWPLQQ